MATVGQLMDQAKQGDAKAAIAVATFLRRRGLSYHDIARFMQERRGIDPNEWEALLLEGDWS